MTDVSIKEENGLLGELAMTEVLLNFSLTCNANKA